MYKYLNILAEFKAFRMYIKVFVFGRTGSFFLIIAVSIMLYTWQSPKLQKQ